MGWCGCLCSLCVPVCVCTDETVFRCKVGFAAPMSILALKSWFWRCIIDCVAVKLIVSPQIWTLAAKLIVSLQHWLCRCKVDFVAAKLILSQQRWFSRRNVDFVATTLNLSLQNCLPCSNKSNVASLKLTFADANLCYQVQKYTLHWQHFCSFKSRI